MVPPKKREEKEPKKRTEDGQMGYLRTREGGGPGRMPMTRRRGR